VLHVGNENAKIILRLGKYITRGYSYGYLSGLVASQAATILLRLDAQKQELDAQLDALLYSSLGQSFSVLTNNPIVYNLSHLSLLTRHRYSAF
jgi:hypothetical protein